VRCCWDAGVVPARAWDGGVFPKAKRTRLRRVGWLVGGTVLGNGGGTVLGNGGGAVPGNGFDMLCKDEAIDGPEDDKRCTLLKRAWLEFGADSIARAGGRALFLENS
jgi:hypothetical protein